MVDQTYDLGKSYRLPWVTMSKPRPRVTKRGTYNPHEYTEWKHNVAEYLNLTYDEGVEGPVSMGIIFEPKRTIITVTPTDIERFGRGDIDNMAGGIMDAFQDAEFIDNDRNVVQMHARFGKDTS